LAIMIREPALSMPEILGYGALADTKNP